MAASSIVMAVFGLAATFLPQELLGRLGHAPSAALTVVVQLTGALYVAFALLNWMAKDSLIGGIYNRPVALGNFLHFAMGALALAKQLGAGPGALLVTLAAIYWIFAFAFGAILFTSPVKALTPRS